MKTRLAATNVESTVSGAGGRAEPTKERKVSANQSKEKRQRVELVDVDVEPHMISLPSRASLWKNPSVFAPLCSQLVLEEDQPIYEQFGESDCLERLAQLALQVSS